MISFNNLGNLGRLANQMFQYASLKGIARNRGYQFYIPPRNVFGKRDPMVQNSDTIIYDVFDLESKNNLGLLPNQVLMERVHTFDQELFINCPDNADLFGYYQSEKYFKHIEDEIRQDFTFSEELQELCDSFIKENFVYRDVISLHIRRGDYVVNPNHPTQDIEYYRQALNQMPDLPVIVFSDDPEWCNEQEFFSSDRFAVSEGNTTDADLCLMSLCKYHIIANSSFSWWGAWLAKSEKIIAPQNWFGGDCVNKSVEDMKFGNWSWV
jgi:Glycosyl transferase family 11